MKSTKFSMIALIISLIIGATSAVALDSTNDKIIITEEVLFGDVNSVSNLTLNIKTQMNNLHIWDIQSPIGNTQNSVVDYTLYNKHYYVNDNIDEYLAIYNISDSSAGTTGIYHLIEEEFSYEGKLNMPLLAIQDVASRTDLNSKHTETIALKDYYEHYQISIDSFLEITHPNNSEYFSSNALNKIRDYFKIPVGNDELTITINKNSEGVNEIACESNGTKTEIISQSVVIDTDVFIALNLKEITGDNVKRIGNTEIYHLDLIMGDEVDIGEITKIKTLDEVYIDSFLYYNDCIIALENNMQKSEFVVYSKDDFTQLQRISISDYGYKMQNVDDAILVSHNNDNFTILTYNNGVFNINFESKFEQVIDVTKDKYYYDSTARFIDGKLIVLSEYKYNYRAMGDILMSVYDKSGLTFASQYSLSQKNDMKDNTNNSVRFEDFFISYS